MGGLITEALVSLFGLQGLANAVGFILQTAAFGGVAWLISSYLPEPRCSAGGWPRAHLPSTVWHSESSDAQAAGIVCRLATSPKADASSAEGTQPQSGSSSRSRLARPRSRLRGLAEGSTCGSAGGGSP